jgi:serine/threonine protein kinase
MKPERWQQVDNLFHSALERSAVDRATFLAQACDGDDALRKEVEALLSAHEEAGSFIESPAVEIEARSVLSEDRTELSVGQMIGHYQIISQLGRGGMGEVFLAQDTTLGRKVALKLLPADFTSDMDRVRRFQQEARAASALNHPNIVTIHEVGRVDQRYFIATEFIDGETLRRRSSENGSDATGDGAKSGASLPLTEVLNIATQIADALAAAHEVGIVHRDIKPENIMLRRRDGYIKVLDFGLAKLTEGLGFSIDTEAPTKAQVSTNPGLLMGTVRYMSPEQTRGENVDVRTDLWSLGVVLYELVAGCAPFERPTPSEVIALILEREPPPLSHYVRGIPSELQRIISKALIKDREERYQTAKDLLIDLSRLQQAVNNRKKVKRTGASTEYLIGKIKRPSTGITIAAATLVLAIAALIYFFYARTNAKAFDSIAVLPFANVSGDPNTEYLSEGIGETLINSLTELRELRVTSRPRPFGTKVKVMTRRP